MRYRELLEDFSGSDFYIEIKKSAVAFGVEERPDVGSGRKIVPEFGPADIANDKIRFSVQGKAAEFMKRPETERFIESRGWIITALTDRTEQRGFEEDGSPRMHHYTLVRLENPSRARSPYEEPQELFHVTAVQNAKNILVHGLEPRGPSRPDLHRYPPRIHFATSRAAAERMKNMFIKHDAKSGREITYVVMWVDPKAVSPKYIDPEFHRDGIYTTEPVPSSAIRLTD